MSSATVQRHWFYIESLTTKRINWKALYQHTGIRATPFTASQFTGNTRLPTIIVDFHLRKYLPQWFGQHQRSLSDVSLVYINAPKAIAVEHVLQAGRVRGVFSPRVTEDKLHQGLSRINRGEHWFSRQLSDQMMDYFHSIFVRFTPPHHVQLTRRELEVLRLLQVGNSNSKLADTLCLSEHTIKSHLYRIFRKLNVNNRQQACEWAHHYLPDQQS